MLNVENKHIHVGTIRVLGVATSSVVLVGDAEIVSCASRFDTPAESLIAGPLVPLAPEG